MRCLITGGCGFIGSNLVEHLTTHGIDVDVVDNMSNGHIEFLHSDDSGCPLFSGTLFQLDFSHDVILNRIKAEVYDYIIHLAAVPRVSYSVEHPLETHETNVTKTLKLIDACREASVTRFIFASSSSVYGGADVLPTPETHPKNPKSPYALQKSIIEDYLKVYHDLYDLDSISLRFFNVFGKNCLGDSPYSTAVSAWLSAVRRGAPIRSDGDGSQTRDMCHVDNVVQAISLSIGSDLKGARRYNVATGSPVSNRKVLDCILEQYPNTIVRNAPWRPGDVMHTHADVSLINQELGFVPTVDFWKGLEKTIEWAMESNLFINLRSNK